jgi:hypothetical protein
VIYDQRVQESGVLLSKLCSEQVGQPCQTCPEVVKSLNLFHLHLRHIHGASFQAPSLQHVSYITDIQTLKPQPSRTIIRKEEWEQRLREVQATKE